MPPVTSGWILANYESDLVTKFYGHILRQDLQIEVVTAVVVSEAGLGDDVNLAEIALGVKPRLWELTVHHPRSFIDESDVFVEINPGSR